MRTVASPRGTPRKDKRVTLITLFSYASEFTAVVEHRSFQLTLKTYRNGSSVAHTETTKSFVPATLDEMTIDLKDGKARRMVFEVQVNGALQRPRFNGFEIWTTRDHADDEVAE